MTSARAANPIFHARDFAANQLRSATRFRQVRMARTSATAAAKNTPPICTHCGTVLNRNLTTWSAGLGSGLSTAIESVRSESATCVPCCRTAAITVPGTLMSGLCGTTVESDGNTKRVRLAAHPRGSCRILPGSVGLGDPDTLSVCCAGRESRRQWNSVLLVQRDTAVSEQRPEH